MSLHKAYTELILILGVVGKTILFFVVLTPPLFGISQSQVISGTILDKENKPVANANIVLTDTAQKILFYKFSDINGYFEFKIADSNKTKKIVFIEITSIGYLKQTHAFISGRKEYSFILELDNKQLPNVQINRQQRVKKSGDTTYYSVSGLVAKEDRSIGDVIARIPGISVAEDGTIKYKDKEIKGLYIQGDDLMEERYGVATREIPKEMIKGIEIIQKFQPIRVLQDKIGTNDVALNLVLKNENALKLTGQASIGLGIPGLADIDLTSILLSKKVKSFISSNYNSTGRLYSGNVMPDILSDALVENPGIPDKYIGKNNSFLGSGNYLYNFKDTLQAKVNINFTYDKNLSEYSMVTKNYLTNDIIVYSENQNAIRRPSSFSSTLTLEQNKQSRYWTNRLRINIDRLRSSSQTFFNSNNLSQSFFLLDRNINNQFSWMPAFKKKNTFSIYLNTQYSEKPQDLWVNPGVDSLFLNHGNGYLSTHQYVKKNLFTNEIGVNYFINDNSSLKKSIKIGYSNEIQKLNSILNLNQLDGKVVQYDGDPGNSITWKKNKPFTSLNLFVNKKYISFNFSIPVSLQYISFKQAPDSPLIIKKNLFVNPKMFLRWFLNPKNYFLLTYNLTNNFGKIDNIYEGLILVDFKQLSRNEGDIQESKRNQLRVEYNFSTAIKMLDFTTGISYTHNRLNSIYSIRYDSNILETVLLPYHSSQSTISYDARISKYVFFLKSKFEALASYTHSLTNQFVNDSFLPYLNNNWKARVSAGCGLLDHLSFYYSGTSSWFLGRKKNYDANENFIDKVSIINNTYSCVITPKIPLIVTVMGQQQINKVRGSRNGNFFFADITFRYKINKPRTEFEIQVNNLFNIKHFETYYLSSNQFFSSSYNLRGRMLLFKVSFGF